MTRRSGLDLAIVGMACRFAGARDLSEFAENVLGGVDPTVAVPLNHGGPRISVDLTSIGTGRVTSYGERSLEKTAGLDPRSFGIIPEAVEGGEPELLLLEEIARAALVDAGLAGGVPDGRRVEVVISRGSESHRGPLTRLQHDRIAAQTVAILGSIHPEWTEADLEAIRLELLGSLPPLTPTANRFDLDGATIIVGPDGASGLVALDRAARSLVAGRSDLALVGGVHLATEGNFRPLEALPRSGQSRPFAADSGGTLIGEGVGVVVLKRLADAERDGDRIYAVVQGVGVARDRRGGGHAAPSARGLARAIRRAYRASGVDPGSVGLIEGQGLGEPAADLAEFRALRATFPPAEPGRRTLGAVSSIIGHAMAAAGIAGLIQTAVALHHRVLPRSLHANRPHPRLLAEGCPVSLNPKARPWVNGDSEAPRRAGVNGFGVAGISAHAVLEAHPSSDLEAAPGALLRWDSEAILISADDRAGLIERCRSLREWLRGDPSPTLKDLAFTLSKAKGSVRVGLVAKSLLDLADRLDTVLAKLADPACRSIRDARGAYFFDRVPGKPSPKLAFLFPGEGSQYPGMLGDLCPHFPEVRALFDTSDRIARESGAPTWPSEHLFGGRPDLGPALWSAGVGVNVVLSAQWALFQLLTRLGVRPDAVVGHSSGELLALAAAGVLEVDRSFEERLGELGAIFGDLETSGDLPTARLVAAGTDRARVEAILGDAGVAIAMDNCPHQVVLAGPPEAVEAVVGRLKAQGVACEDLPFSRAYHTPGFAPAIGPIEAFFAARKPVRPRVPIYSCATEGRMPGDPEAIRRLAIDQWTRPVGFRRTVEAMHADGLRVFVDVGARGNLAGFVEDTLRGRPSFAVAANLPRRSGLLQLNHLVASLFAQGIEIRTEHLYARRRPLRIDLDAVPRKVANPPALAVGFPTMRLSEPMVARLRERVGSSIAHASISGRATPPPTQPFPTRGEGFQTEAFPPIAERLRLPPSPPIDKCICLAPSPLVGEGWGGGTSAEGEPLPFHKANGHARPDQIPLQAFQETMAAFLKTQREVMDAFLTGHASAVEPISQPGPWAGELISLIEGSEAVSRITLDAVGDPVAEHHTLGGRRISAVYPEWRGLPVLPFSVMAEMLAEAASRLAPGLTLVALREVRAHKWIRYEDEPITLELRARLDPDRTGSVSVAIHNRGPSRALRPTEAAVFEGVAVFDQVRCQPPIPAPFALEAPDACRFTPRSIYGEQWLFHGPALQAVVGIGPISMDGIEGTLRVLPLAPLLRDGASVEGVQTDPIILDNFTHLLGGWGLDRLADDGDVIFPLGMEELTILGDRPPEGSDVACRITIRECERHRVRADAEIIGPDGRTWMAIRGWEDWRFRWPSRYRDGFRQPDRTLLGEPLALSGHEGRAVAVWLEPPPDMGRPVWRDVLEHVQLGPDERAASLALPGPDSRRTHRLWGKIAAKEAARRLWLGRGDRPTYPADLLVEPDGKGRPVLRSRGPMGRADLPSLSIAHVDGLAVALACLDPRARVGIDVEPIVERSGGFEATAFLAGERAILGARTGSGRAEWVARLWCGKEAAAKATGFGFVEGPSGVEVVSAGVDGVLGVRLRGELASSCPDLAGFTIRVVTERRGGWIWAWTLGERGER